MSMEDNLYQEYLNWFEEKFGSFPDEIVGTTSTINEILSLRQCIESGSMTNKEKYMKRLNVITFEEYKKSKE